MLFKFPKDDRNFSWTSHVKNKMIFYRISEQKIKSILRSPDRKEEGIAPNTSAAMKRNDKPSKKEELWVMYATGTNNNKEKTDTEEKQPKLGGKKMRIISAWRYPGISPKGNNIPIPHDIQDELAGML